MKKMSILVAVLLSLTVTNVQADNHTNAKTLAMKYTTNARLIDESFTPSPAAGKQFFNRMVKNDGHEVACASCHTKNPADAGKNIVTKKPIKPLSPVINTERFTNIADVEENFSEHCNDIVGSECSAQEKANFITYLLTEKTPSK